MHYLQKDITKVLCEDLPNEAYVAKIDLIIHKYSMILRQWPSKVTSAFVKTKKLGELDAEWMKNLASY